MPYKVSSNKSKTKKQSKVKTITKKYNSVNNNSNNSVVNGNNKSVNKKLINTRNEKCVASKSTKCCPHMNPDEKGRYQATNEKSILHYKGAKYELHTCCLMCSEAMNKLAKSNITKFNKLHKPLKQGSGLLLANGHTGKYVQFVKLIES